jgi:hypothetical protein
MDEQTIRIVSGILAAVCFLLLLQRRARRKSKQNPET